MPDQMAEGEVRYYDPGARTIAPGNFWSSGNTRDAAGGWIASAIDLVRFASALDGLGTPALLRPETVQQMRARPAAPLWVDSESYYGLGWTVRSAERTVWSHRGSLPRTMAEVVGNSEGFARAVLFNTRPESWNAFQQDVHQTLHDAYGDVAIWPGHDLFAGYTRADRTRDEVHTLSIDRAAEVARLQPGLAETLEGKGSVTSPAVFAAFRAVPRHLFLPNVALAEVYRDRAIGTKMLDGRAVSVVVAARDHGDHAGDARPPVRPERTGDRGRDGLQRGADGPPRRRDRRGHGDRRGRRHRGGGPGAPGSGRRRARSRDPWGWGAGPP